jgi:radical SAM protein with 4Fe4S-binding SPASM domain
MAYLRAKLELLFGIIQGEKAYTGPSYVILDVIRRCNIRCIGCFFHCKQERKPMPGNPIIGELSFQLVEKICNELPSFGIKEIILLGEGEPFLHPHLMDFIAAFKRAGLRVQAFTNGTLLHAKTIDRILESGLDVLHATLWAVNESEHSACHPETSLSYLKKRIQGIELLASRKRQKGLKFPIINLHLPINRNNHQNIQGREELASRLGCDSVSLGFFRDWGGCFEHLTLSPGDLDNISGDLSRMQKRLKSEHIFLNVEEYLGQARLGPNAWRAVPCYVGWYQSYIKVDGTILPCGHCYYDVGNMMEQSFESIWNGTKMREFRQNGLRMQNAQAPPLHCDCVNCCNIKDNLRVHRVFKWVAPLLPRAWSDVITETSCGA